MAGQPSPIKLVFWVELGPMPWYVVGSGGPRPEGHRLMGTASRSDSAAHSNINFQQSRHGC